MISAFCEIENRKKEKYLNLPVPNKVQMHNYTNPNHSQSHGKISKATNSAVSYAYQMVRQSQFLHRVWRVAEQFALHHINDRINAYFSHKTLAAENLCN